MGSPSVVIVGGGYGGVAVARRLEEALPARRARVTLVAPENVQLFTPLLSLVAAGTLEPRHAVVPLRRMLHRTSIVLGGAASIDLAARTLTVTSRPGAASPVPFDRLVLAPGSVTRLPAVDGLAGRALGVKALSEAVAVRNHVVEQLELAEAASDEAERRRRTTFVVVGAGQAGVEMVAELQSGTRRALRYFPRLQERGVRWLLLQHGPRILPEGDDRPAADALRALRGLGVEVRTQSTVEQAGQGWVRLTGGERLATETLIWTAGVAPQPWVAGLGLPRDDQGRLLVDEHLAVAGHPDIYAVGDAARVPDPLAPSGTAPPTATHAAQQGQTCADNVTASLGVGVRRSHRHRDRVAVVNLGNRRGVGKAYGVRLSGAIGWAVTVVTRVRALPAGHRASVALAWAARAGRRRDIADLGSLGSTDPHAAAEPRIPQQRRPALDVPTDDAGDGDRGTGRPGPVVDRSEGPGAGCALGGPAAQMAWSAGF